MARKNTTRETILSVSAARFAKYGFEGTSLADISNEVGIQKSALYAHFSNKNHLFLEVYEQAHKLAANQLSEIYFSPSYSDEEKLRRIFYASCGNESSKIFRMSVNIIPEIEEDVSRILHEFQAGTATITKDLFRRVQARGGISDRSVDDIFDIYINFMNGVLFRIVDSAAPYPYRLDLIWQSFCEWAGMENTLGQFE